MVSLSLMARLIEALRDGARLVLVGDPAQLASIEAGAVLGDIVGPAAVAPLIGPAAAQRLSAATGASVAGRRRGRLRRRDRGAGARAPLRRRDRRAGDRDQARRPGRASLELLARSPEGVRWIETDLSDEGGAGARARRGDRRRGRGDRGGTGGRRRARPAGARQLPDPVRAPARAVRGRELDRAPGGLAWPTRSTASAGTSGGRCW